MYSVTFHLSPPYNSTAIVAALTQNKESKNKQDTFTKLYAGAFCFSSKLNSMQCVSTVSVTFPRRWFFFCHFVHFLFTGHFFLVFHLIFCLLIPSFKGNLILFLCAILPVKQNETQMLEKRNQLISSCITSMKRTKNNTHIHTQKSCQWKWQYMKCALFNAYVKCQTGCSPFQVYCIYNVYNHIEVGAYALRRLHYNLFYFPVCFPLSFVCWQLFSFLCW